MEVRAGMDSSAPLDTSELSAMRSCVTRFRQAMEKTTFDRKTGNLTRFQVQKHAKACKRGQNYLLLTSCFDLEAKSGRPIKEKLIDLPYGV